MSNVMKQKDIMNQLELIDEVENVLNEVVQEKSDKTIDSIPSKNRYWLKQNGEHINY